MDQDNFKSPTRRELAAMVGQWEKRAGNYFILAEREIDPLGEKFYRSAALVYANCAAGVRRLLDQAIVVSHTHSAKT